MGNDLVQRLRGNYSVAVNDGAGPLDGKDTYKRSFTMTPICGEAADEIERLRAEVAEWKRVASAQADLHDTAERELAELRDRFEKAPVAIMDTRDVLYICAPTEEDFPALYAIQGHRVRLVRED